MNIKSLTNILRGVFASMILPIIFICVFYLPYQVFHWINGDISMDYIEIILMIMVCFMAVPYTIIIVKANLLLNYFYKEQYVNDHTILLLKQTRDLFLILSGLVIVTLPFLYVLADRQDAPGILFLALVGLGLIFVFYLTFAIFHLVFKSL